MVVFTCQHCGESLKKSAVEKHYQFRKCRNSNPSLTCVDCLKDFFGDEFIGHTSCVSELERYSAKGTVIKEAGGKKKQAQYIEMIQNVLLMKDLSAQQRQFLNRISSFDNVPKKHNKFMNFIQNVVRPPPSYDVIDSVFHLLESTWKKEKEQQSAAPESDVKGAHKVVDSPVKNGGSDQSPKGENFENGDCKEESKENNCGMSKKELKKKKKYVKYLLDLESAKTEKSENMEVEETETSNSDNRKIKKLNKKDKTKISFNDQMKSNTTEIHGKLEEPVSKKQKKRKIECSEPEVVGKKSKLGSPEVEEEDENLNISHSFDWADVIKTVLSQKSEKELSLKRLGKKVIDEYQSRRPTDHHSYEQLLAKFNKKVKKTMGVRVLNDKAKLIE